MAEAMRDGNNRLRGSRLARFGTDENVGQRRWQQPA
jgi:hypothetical protein